MTNHPFSYPILLAATVGLFVFTAPAAATAGRLPIATAQRIARNIALRDMSEWDSYPRYTVLGGPSCKRVTARHVRCLYSITERLTDEPDAPANPKSCDRQVDVRLRRGARRPTASMLSLGCHNRRSSY